MIRVSDVEDAVIVVGGASDVAAALFEMNVSWFSSLSVTPAFNVFSDFIVFIEHKR
jgi:hypothetical protein